MRATWLFFSLEGRIDRKSFWLGAALLIAAGIALGWALFAAFGLADAELAPTGFSSLEAARDQLGRAQQVEWIQLALFVVLAIPAYPLMIKRRHDRGRAGTDVIAFAILSVPVIVAGALGAGFQVVSVNGGYVAAPQLWYSAAQLGRDAFGLYLLVVLGLLRGDRGANIYGPDPLAAD